MKKRYIISMVFAGIIVYFLLQNLLEEHTVYEVIMESTEEPNFFLYVSDQSFAISPVDITVFIDDELALQGNFTVGDQHNFSLIPLSLSNGTHTIFVKSIHGDAELEEEFVINGTRWAMLDYFKEFSFKMFTEQPSFR